MYIAIVDIVIVGIIALLALRCAIKGFVSELLSMAALVFGLLFAIFFFRRAAVVVGERFLPDMQILAEIITFAILFITVFVLIKLLELLLKSIIGKIKLTGVDRFLGFFYGIVEGIVVVYLLLFLINIQPFIEPDLILGRSLLAGKLMQLITGNIGELVESIAWAGAIPAGIFALV